jgi:hypothetical protein
MHVLNIKRMFRRRNILAVSCSIVLIGIYIGTFSYWWFSSPTKMMMIKGKQVRVVEFHYNSLLWHTEVIWVPAFLFVDNICGYKLG